MQFWRYLVIVAAAAVWPQLSHAVPQSYPMICRGGGGTLGFNAAGAHKNALFYFSKSAQPAGAGLQPGMCSWTDRGIGANEPTCLMQSNAQVASWIFPSQLGNSYHSSTNAPWIRNLLKATAFQTFQVYNPGNSGCFVVTKLGP